VYYWLAANGSNRIKTCPSVTPSTINPTWTGLGSNLVLYCGGASSHLTYGRGLASCRVQYQCWRSQQWYYSLNGGNIRSILTVANHIQGISGLVSTNIRPILFSSTTVRAQILEVSICSLRADWIINSQPIALRHAWLTHSLGFSHSLCYSGLTVTSESNGAFCWGACIGTKIWCCKNCTGRLQQFCDVCVCMCLCVWVRARACESVFMFTKLTGWLKD
jgi:hypothetical protein